MDTAKRLKDLVKRRGWAQYEIGQKLELSPSTAANYFTGRTPEPLVCLLLAGLGDSEDRDFWIAASGLSEQQLRLIKRGLRVEAPSIEEMRDVADLLNNPQDRREQAVVDLVRVTVQNRIEIRGNQR